MAMDRATLETHLKEAFPDAEITLTDLEQFKGVSRVKQHQMVYAALKGKMGGELHALALKTSAPA